MNSSVTFPAKAAPGQVLEVSIIPKFVDWEIVSTDLSSDPDTFASISAAIEGSSAGTLTTAYLFIPNDAIVGHTVSFVVHCIHQSDASENTIDYKPNGTTSGDTQGNVTIVSGAPVESRVYADGTGDYPSLALWLSDVVASGTVNHTALCRGDVLTSGTLSIPEMYGADATYHLAVKGDAGYRHDGTLAGAPAQISGVINSDNNFFAIDGLRINGNDSTHSVTSSRSVSILNCLYVSPTATNAFKRLLDFSAERDSFVSVVNNFVICQGDVGDNDDDDHGDTQVAIFMVDNGFAVTANLDHNTFLGTGNAIDGAIDARGCNSGSSQINIRNSLFCGFTFSNSAQHGAFASMYYLSPLNGEVANNGISGQQGSSRDSTTNPIPPSSQYAQAEWFINDLYAPDARISQTSFAVGAGTNRLAHAATDIFGNARPSTAVDIGAMQHGSDSRGWRSFWFQPYTDAVLLDALPDNSDAITQAVVQQPYIWTDGPGRFDNVPSDVPGDRTIDDAFPSTGVRYLGQFAANATGDYVFENRSDDGMRLYVDGTLVIDDWTEHGVDVVSNTIHLVAGGYPIQIEWFNKTSDNNLDVRVAPPGHRQQGVASIFATIVSVDTSGPTLYYRRNVLMPVLRTIRRNESVAASRRVGFLIVGNDGKTPVTTMNGQQPQISIDGGAWADTGIGELNHIGNGRYYAELTQSATDAFPRSIECRFQQTGTLEIPGDSVEIVQFKSGDEYARGTIRATGTALAIAVNDDGLDGAGKYVGATLVMVSGALKGNADKISAYVTTSGARVLNLTKGLSGTGYAVDDAFIIIGA